MSLFRAAGLPFVRGKGWPASEGLCGEEDARCG